MYQVLCDEQILYDTRTEDRVLINPILTLEVNKTSSLTFYKPSTNPMKINKLKSVIEVYQDGILLFSGRALNDKKDFYNTGKIICEGELSYLLDSIMGPYNFENMSVRDVLNILLTNHNKQVKEAKKQFLLGNVNVIDNIGDADSIYRSSNDFTKTLHIIQDKFIEELGGYIQVRRTKTAKYIDYLAECTHKNSQVIRFRSNLLDLTQFAKSEDIITCLIPLGSKDENNIYTTIESTNNGLNYIYDETAVNLYGWIWGVKQWENVTTPRNLLTKAKTYLKDCINLSLSLELSAVDLSLLDVNIEKIKVGDWIKVISEPHGLDKYFLVNKMTLDLANPSNNKIFLGDAYRGLTDRNLQSQKSSYKDLNKIVIREANNTKNIKKVTEESSNTKKELTNYKKIAIMGVL